LTGNNLSQQLLGPGPVFTFTNLSPDANYKYNVQDAAGNFCELNYSLLVEPTVLATAGDFADALCIGGYGKATITVTSGGSAPYEYFDGNGWAEFISGNPIDLPSNG